MKIAVLIGRGEDDIVPPNRRYKNVPKQLRDSEGNVPADVAVADVLMDKHQNVTLIEPREVINLREFDLTYSIFDLVDSFQEGGIKEYEKRRKMLRGVSLYPSLPLQDFITAKSKYLRSLKKVGIPIIPFVYLSRSTFLSAPKTSINKILKRCQWKGLVIKPEMSTLSENVLFYKNRNRIRQETIQKYADKVLRRQHHPGILFQKYVEELKTSFEYRLYFVCGKFVKAIGTYYHTNDIFDSKNLNLRTVNDLKILSAKATKVFSDRFNNAELLLRFDYAVCEDGKYYLNEVETTPHLKVSKTDKVNVVNEIAKAIIKLAKK